MSDKLVKSKITMAKKKVHQSDKTGNARKSFSDDMYFSYFEETKDAAQRRSWTFYEAINLYEIKKSDHTRHRGCFDSAKQAGKTYEPFCTAVYGTPGGGAKRRFI